MDGSPHTWATRCHLQENGETKKADKATKAPVSGDQSSSGDSDCSDDSEEEEEEEESSESETEVRPSGSMGWFLSLFSGGVMPHP